MAEGWAKVPRAAKYAGVSERTLRPWLKKGLRHVRLPSGTVLIRYSDLDEFLETFLVDESLVDRLVEETLREVIR